MAKSLPLQLYVLLHPDLEQAAWVRASTSSEASQSFSNRTDILVIVPNDYGWVPFPEGRQHSKNEERPVPRWEYRQFVCRPADLAGMPQYIRALREKRAPQRQGQVSVGRAFPRTTPIDFRSISAAKVVGRVKVFHSGYQTEYYTPASQLSGFPKDTDSIEIGKTALLELLEDKEFYQAFGKESYPRINDIVQVRLDDGYSDYLMTGKVVRHSVVVDVVSIEKQA